MTITGRKLLRAFYHITTAIVVLGMIILFTENDPDILYGVWVAVAMMAGSYLIETR